MSRFFTPTEQIGKNTAYITGEDAYHISRVLRKDCGDVITVCDGVGNDYSCKISDITQDRVELEIISRNPCESEPNIKLSLFVALSKGDKLDYVVQKCIELGVFEITPFVSSRCVVKTSEKDTVKKTARRQRIAYEASKQSGRGIVPKIHVPIAFAEMTGKALASESALLLYEGETEKTLKSALNSLHGNTLSVVIGPEGGFSPDEVDLALNRGLISVTLGKRILRCETAPVCAVSAIMFHTDNL